MDNTIINLLHDFASLLYERAKEAQDRCKSSAVHADNSQDKDFDCGRALAYYEVVTLFVSQAELFGISEKDIHISKEDLDELLK